MDRDTLRSIAQQLKQAERSGIAVPQISRANPGLTVDDAYRIQLTNIDLEVAGGRRIVGKKIGLTSPPMQQLLGVDQPDYGHLLDSMQVKGGKTPLKGLLQPKVEGEIAFVLKRDLTGDQNTVQTVLDATDYVVAAIEVVDSRVADWRITIVDTVADNASSGLYVLGDTRCAVTDIDRKGICMGLYKNGQLLNQGQGSAVLGDPAYAVAWLANMLHRYGVPLKAGEIILSGALTAAVPAQAGDCFTAQFDTLGDVKLCFE